MLFECHSAIWRLDGFMLDEFVLRASSLLKGE